MPKKAALNNFTGGLSLDLNEQNNSDKVLTDAINATLVTGNGDEYILQNDMGNVKIPTGEYKEYAQLDDGYIPMGVKELNGVAYLVSYNPETKKTQLGTYPGPRDYTLTLEGKSAITFPSTETIFDLPLKQPDDEYLPRLRYGDKLSIKIPIDIYNSVNIRGIKQDNQKAYDLEFITKINNVPTSLNTEYSVWNYSKPDKEGNPSVAGKEISFTYTQSTGELALKVTPNKILTLTVGCSLIKKEDFNIVKNMNSENAEWMSDIKSAANLLVFNISYTYNTDPDYINGLSIEINGKETYHIKHNSESAKQIGNVYVSTIEAYCTLDKESKEHKESEELPNIIEYKVTAKTFNEYQEPSVKGEINTQLEGLILNTWRYNDSELIYGFADNTLYNSKDNILTLTFLNIITKEKLVYSTTKKSFNGTFIFEKYSELKKDSIYLCKIQLENNPPFYRWVFTNGQYNEAFNNVKDFGSTKIVQYNDIEATFDPFAGEEPQLLVKDTVTSKSPFISTEKHDYGAQILNQEHHIKVQNSRVFSLDDNLFSISDSPTLPKTIDFTSDNQTSECPINSINNTFTDLGDAATWVRQNSSKLDDQYISIKDGIIDFIYNNRSAAVGKIKELKNVTADSYFRPFMIDPEKVDREQRISLRSNMLAFGNEIRKDYLPMEYLMLQVLRNGDTNTLQRYLISRESIDNKINTITETSTNKQYLVPEQVSDDDEARHTDLGSTAKLISEDSEDLVQEGISVVDDYISSINTVKEIDNLKEDADYTILQINANSSTYDKLAYIFDTKVDLTSKDKFDDFKLIPFYFLNSHNWSTNKFLPTLFFIGSYNLIDGLHYNDEASKTGIEVTINGKTEKYDVDMFDSWDGYMYDNDGNKLSFNGGNDPRADSGWQCREGYNKDLKYSRYNTLIPLWMNDDGTYTTLNYLIHYLNDVQKYENVTKYSEDKNTIETYGAKKGLDLIGSVIKNLIDLFQNYYLYTNLRIEIPNLTLYIINPEDTTYTTQYTNDIIYNNVRVQLSDSDLLIGGTHYTELIERSFNEFPELTDIQIEELKTTARMNLIGYNPSITFTQRQKSYSEYLNNYISGDVVHYPICYTGTKYYITDIDGNELDKDKCYILGDTGLSNVSNNPFTLVNIDAPIGNYSTLLLKKENQAQLPSNKKPAYAPSLYKHNGMFLTTKNLPINFTVWNYQGNEKDLTASRNSLMGTSLIGDKLPSDEKNYFYNSTDKWNDLYANTEPINDTVRNTV